LWEPPTGYYFFYFGFEVVFEDGYQVGASFVSGGGHGFGRKGEQALTPLYGALDYAFGGD
jgi:hypothetical protein